MKAAGKYSLLVPDNHHSHVIDRFLKFCYDNYILALSLPLHALQPLDIEVFGPTTSKR